MAIIRWLAFAAGLALVVSTVIAVMKILIVPRRSWTLISATIGRNGFRFFHAIAVRLPTFDAADRFLGFLAPTVIIATLGALLGSFVVGFALLLMPWGDPTIGDALREAGSSVFTLGFVSTPEPVPTALDVAAGATGMIFVALTIGWLPALYSEVKRREALVKQLEGWTGTPPWGPEILARLTMAGAVHRLPTVFADWDAWCAQVSDTHMKYPVLAQFRLPRSRNHWVIALLGVLDAAAIDLALRPSADHAVTRLLLRQGATCLRQVAYPMRRVRAATPDPGIDAGEFVAAVERLTSAGYPAERTATDAWQKFASLRSSYAPIATELAFWLLAVPAPWSGERDGFPGLVWWPDSPAAGTIEP
jgi:hypothetical protein